MEISELKTLLKFQNVQLEDSPPGMKSVKSVYGASKRLQKSVTTDKCAEDRIEAEPKIINIIDPDRSTQWKPLDLGGGDSMHLPLQETIYCSSESVTGDELSSSSMPSGSSFDSSKMYTSSTKSSLNSFPEIKAPYQRRTYVSCLKKLDSNTQTLMQMLKRIPKPTEQLMNFTPENKGESVKDFGNEENADRNPSESPRPKVITEDTKPNGEPPQSQVKTEDTKPNEEPPAPQVETEDTKPNPESPQAQVTTEDTKPSAYYSSDEGIEYSDEGTEESDLEAEDSMDVDSDVNYYEKAKEIVRKITGREPPSEEEYATEDEEIPVFHFRPYRGKAETQRRRGNTASRRTVVVKKTSEALEAASCAQKATESLRRAQPYFRDVSPMARVLQKN